MITKLIEYDNSYSKFQEETEIEDLDVFISNEIVMHVAYDLENKCWILDLLRNEDFRYRKVIKKADSYIGDIDKFIAMSKTKPTIRGLYTEDNTELIDLFYLIVHNRFYAITSTWKSKSETYKLLNNLSIKKVVWFKESSVLIVTFENMSEMRFASPEIAKNVYDYIVDNNLYLF